MVANRNKVGFLINKNLYKKKLGKLLGINECVPTITFKYVKITNRR